MAGTSNRAAIAKLEVRRRETGLHIVSTPSWIGDTLTHATFLSPGVRRPQRGSGRWMANDRHYGNRGRQAKKNRDEFGMARVLQFPARVARRRLTNVSATNGGKTGQKL